MNADVDIMARALTLAERGRGFVEPNPLVGAVVVDADGAIVGEGWHERYGEAHAEVNALAQGNGRGHTLYVTLEPCCHTGKTPPCTEAILKSGIRRVVAAMSDPFPQVSGSGIEVLKNAGIDVQVGMLERPASILNAPYLKLLRTGLPWVHLKWAMTLDGRIATRSGESKWISNEASRAKVHELRGRMDAILVGRGTVIADDPLLTARPAGPRIAARVIVTFSGDLPTECRLRASAKDSPVIIYTSQGMEDRLAGWAADGAEIVGLPITGAGLPPEEILRDLGRRRFTNVLVEGGPGLAGRFFDAGAVDELHAFVAPILFGGEGAPGPLGGFGIERLNQAFAIEHLSVQQLGSDVYLHGMRPQV